MRRDGRRGSRVRAVTGRALALATGFTLVGGIVAPLAAEALSAKRDPNVVVSYDVPQPPLPPKGVPFVIADANTGAVIAQRFAHKKLPPASTLKMLTALALLPRLDPRTEVTANWKEVTVEGTRVGMVMGARYRVSDLFYGMFLASGNDASLALSKVAGGDALTVAQMQHIAKAIGANDTTPLNPDGLDTKGQFSSAHDLCLIAMYGLRRPDFASYVATKMVKFPGRPAAKKGQHRQTFQVWNINRFMLSGYTGAIGVKSGYTTHAHNTLVIAATRGHRTYLVSLMGMQANIYAYAIPLMDWAFKYGGKVHPVDSLYPPKPTIAPTASATPSKAAAAVGGGNVQASSPAPSNSGVRFPMPVVAAWGIGTAIVVAFLVRRRRAEGPDLDDF